MPCDGARRLRARPRTTRPSPPRRGPARPWTARPARRRARSGAWGRSASPRRSAARSSVPTTSGPSARYSSASLATWASPISWISWAVLLGGREVAQGGVVGVVAAGQPGQPALAPRTGPAGSAVAQGVAVGLEARPDATARRPRAARRGAASASTPVGRASPRPTHRVVGERHGERAPRSARSSRRPRTPGTPSRWRHALADAVGQLPEVGADAVELGRHRVGDGLVGHGEQAHQQRQRALRPVHGVGVASPLSGVSSRSAEAMADDDDHPAGQPLLARRDRLVDGASARVAKSRRVAA